MNEHRRSACCNRYIVSMWTEAGFMFCSVKCLIWYSKGFDCGQCTRRQCTACVVYYVRRRLSKGFLHDAFIRSKVGRAAWKHSNANQGNNMVRPVVCLLLEQITYLLVIQLTEVFYETSIWDQINIGVMHSVDSWWLFSNSRQWFSRSEKLVHSCVFH